MQAVGELVGEPVGEERSQHFVVESLELVHRPRGPATDLQARRSVPLGKALLARAALYKRIRRFFEERHFLEVHTAAWTRTPGTDPHLEPVAAEFFEPHDKEHAQTAYLHTSPELMMKELLCEGAGPIYQLTRVWRNGEVTDLHNPEFEILEWYRPWAEVEEIIDDVEALVCEVLHKQSPRPTTPPIQRITMQEAFLEACGFDLLQALDAESLREEIRRLDLLSERAASAGRWDELFFSLSVSYLDPFLKTLGAVFLTDWPAPLAILASRCPDDPRVARRFELYIDGIELANGFGELTDADEQRLRFEEDNLHRQELGLPTLPLPERFLTALQWGLPPSAGVALGVDRLLMLATENARTLRDVLPFALTRTARGIQWP